MEKEQSSKETVEQIIRDVCCGSGSKKKKRTKKLSEMVETEIDIFANTEEHQYINIKRGTKK